MPGKEKTAGILAVFIAKPIMPSNILIFQRLGMGLFYVARRNFSRNRQDSLFFKQGLAKYYYLIIYDRACKSNKIYAGK